MEIDPDLPLRGQAASGSPPILQQRFRATFELMASRSGWPAGRPRARQRPRRSPSRAHAGPARRPSSASSSPHTPSSAGPRTSCTDSRLLHLRRQPPAHHRRTTPHPRGDRRRPPARAARPREGDALMLLRLLRTAPRAVQAVAGRHRGAAVHRDGRDALPAQPQRRHHRPRAWRSATPTTSCTPARSCSGSRWSRSSARSSRSPARLAPRCRSAGTSGPRSSTGWARSPAARSHSSALPR